MTSVQFKAAGLALIFLLEAFFCQQLWQQEHRLFILYGTQVVKYEDGIHSVGIPVNFFTENDKAFVPPVALWKIEMVVYRRVIEKGPKGKIREILFVNNRPIAEISSERGRDGRVITVFPFDDFSVAVSGDADKAQIYAYSHKRYTYYTWDLDKEGFYTDFKNGFATWHGI